MRVKESIVTKKRIIQIYLTEEERKNTQIQKQINEIKLNAPVVIFISGKEKAKEVLKNMVRTMKE